MATTIDASGLAKIIDRRLAARAHQSGGNHCFGA